MEINGKKKIVKFLPSFVCHPERSEGPSFKIKDSSAKPQNDNQFCLQVEGKNPVSVKDFLNGYPELKKVTQLLLSR